MLNVYILRMNATLLNEEVGNKIIVLLHAGAVQKGGGLAESKSSCWLTEPENTVVLVLKLFCSLYNWLECLLSHTTVLALEKECPAHHVNYPSS